jgi:hypothetical protein
MVMRHVQQHAVRNVTMMVSVIMRKAVIALTVPTEILMIPIIVKIDFDAQKMNLNLLV